MNILFNGQKGGLGKTTSTTNLAYCFAKLGHSTCIVDMGPQGNVSDILGFEPANHAYKLMDLESDADIVTQTEHNENLYIVSGSRRSETIVHMHKSDDLEFSEIAEHVNARLSCFDFVFWDSEPSGYLQELCIYLAGHCMFPTTLDFLSMVQLEKVLATSKSIWAKKGIEPQYDIVPVRVSHIHDNDRTCLSSELMPKDNGLPTSDTRHCYSELVAAHGDAVSKYYLPERVAMDEAIARGLTIMQHAPDNILTHAYAKITAALLGLDEGVVYETVTA